MPERRVNVLLGTRKGAYIARSDRHRKNWKIEGPYQEGNEVFHVAPDPRHPGHVYSLANNSFFGPSVYRSTDHGRHWKEIATPGLDRRRGRKVSSGGNRRPIPIENLWHFEPGPASAPRQLYIGVAPHLLFRSDDAGRSWTSLKSVANHPTRKRWMPGAGGACLHTVVLDPKRPQRMYIGLSAAGTFRSDDGGESWVPRNRGVETPFLPVRFPEVGQCVHHFALDPHDPKVAYRQDHGGIYVSEDSMDHWERVGSQLDSDFGFVVATAPALPGGAIFVPLSGETRTVSGRKAQIQWYDRRTGNFRPMIRHSPFAGDFGTHREGLATDQLDPAGIYLGTTTGNLIYSPTGGKSWGSIPFQFPAIHSVSVSVD
ncbi:MAG: WD40/YVTN/BNR-like repeat-containing protein [Thermoplasmata archaeon]